MRDFDYLRRFHKEGNKNMREFRVGRGSQLCTFIKMEEAKFEDKEGIFPARLAPILFTWNDSFDNQVAKFNCLMRRYDLYMIYLT